MRVAHFEQADKAMKRKEEYEASILKVIETLKQVQADMAAPKSVKKLVKEATDVLAKENTTVGVRAASAVQLLEEANQDTNLPMLSRTRIWNALTLLEKIKD